MENERETIKWYSRKRGLVWGSHAPISIVGFCSRFRVYSHSKRGV